MTAVSGAVKGLPWWAVPEEWAVRPLRTEFRRHKVLGSGTEELLSVYRDYGVIPKSSRDDNFNRPSEDLSKYQLVSTGDLVVNKMKAWQGSLAVSSCDGIVSPAYFVYKPIGTLDRRFAHYLLRSKGYVDHWAAISFGIRPNQWDLDPAKFAATPLLVPPLRVQQAIADLLDHETAQIDAFIAKNEQLIALLIERRSALVRHAVDGAVVDERPTGTWRLSQLATLINGHPFDATEFQPVGDIPVVRIRDLSASEFETFIRRDLVPRGAMVRDGDVLIGMDGDFNAVLWDRGPAALNQRVCALRAHPGVADPRFLAYAIAHPLRRINDLTWATTVKHLSSGAVRAIRVPAYGFRAQQQIADFIEGRTRSIDESIRTARRAIDLARERRSALISAAVTGKIDVGAAA